MGEGKIETFVVHETGYDLQFKTGEYFDGVSLPIEFSTPNYLKATNDDGQTFIYRSGRFHFAFISYYHVSSFSGDCRHVPRVIEG